MTKAASGAASVRKILGIDPKERYEYQPIELDRCGREALGSAGADIFFEQEPTVIEWLRESAPTTKDASDYFLGLFPPIKWLPRYNLRWLLGDVIAGITIGLVVVPQAMAYALLAKQTASVGLYTSFTGAVLYWFFGTSKDIVIGTTAVGSLLVGQVITRVKESHPDASNLAIAHTLSMLAGAVLLAIGLLRLGWVIELIPYIPISAFVTAASITIMSTQLPNALGISGVDTSTPPYLTIINTLKHLDGIKVDAAIGISTTVLLFLIKGFCARMEKRQPANKRTWSFISSLRMTFVVLLFTLISFLLNRGLDLPKFRIVGRIETGTQWLLGGVASCTNSIGFRGAHIPNPTADLMRIILPELPAVVIILVIEHIAIAKAMGRVHNYTVNPSQEIVALGGANMLSPFVGGYVCTGSFSASAVLSKAGSRTPLAGLFSAIVLVLVLYLLTGVFYFIPHACLSGLILHAVCSLVTRPHKVYRYWQFSPIEFAIWVVCVAVGLFQSLEYCIYVGVGLSIGLVLLRLARTKGQFLGKVKAQRVKVDNTTDTDGHITLERPRTIYAPFRQNDGMNPAIYIDSPHPGIFIYRLSESLNYTNQAFHMEILQEHIITNTKRTSEEVLERQSDRMWNDPGPQHMQNEDMPLLRAIVLDFAAVNNLDVTALQGLIDMRNFLDKYTYPDAAEWHFAGVDNRWTRRALASAGFGYPSAKSPEAIGAWRPIYSIAQTLMSDEFTPLTSHSRRSDSESTSTNQAALYGIDRPFFHVDLYDAVQAATRDAKGRDKEGC